jgi:hypothetical protein
MPSAGRTGAGVGKSMRAPLDGARRSAGLVQRFNTQADNCSAAAVVNGPVPAPFRAHSGRSIIRRSVGGGSVHRCGEDRIGRRLRVSSFTHN